MNNKLFCPSRNGKILSNAYFCMPAGIIIEKAKGQ